MLILWLAQILGTSYDRKVAQVCFDHWEMNGNFHNLFFGKNSLFCLSNQILGRPMFDLVAGIPAKHGPRWSPFLLTCISSSKFLRSVSGPSSNRNTSLLFVGIFNEYFIPNMSIIFLSNIHFYIIWTNSNTLPQVDIFDFPNPCMVVTAFCTGLAFFKWI